MPLSTVEKKRAGWVREREREREGTLTCGVGKSLTEAGEAAFET